MGVREKPTSLLYPAGSFSSWLLLPQPLLTFWLVESFFVLLLFYTLFGTKERLSTLFIALVVALLYALKKVSSSLKMVFICSGIVWAILLFMFWGTVAPMARFRCDSEAAVSYYVGSIPRNSARVAAFSERMASRHGIRVDRIDGIDAKQTNTTEQVVRAYNVSYKVLPKDDFRGHVAIFLGNRAAFETIANNPNEKSDWVVLFEDDAVAYFGFVRRLQDAFCTFRDADLVWLDTRNAPSWAFLGEVHGGTNALAVKVTSLRKLADLMQFDGDVFVKELRGDNPKGKQDEFFAKLCNTGQLVCGFSPLVVETGQASSHLNWWA